MRQALSKLLAILTLSQICLLYGGALLFVYQEQSSGASSSCPRSCCHLAKTGSSSFATACCAVRCGEPAGERGSEPARTRITLDALYSPAVTPLAVGLADDPPQQRVPLEFFCYQPADGQPDLHIKYSVFLV